jgi:hypothetical protein
MNRSSMKNIALAGVASALVLGGASALAVSASAEPPTFTTLAEAAAQPHGIGQESEVAKQVKGDKEKKVKPEDVFKTNSSKRGGCIPFYSLGGQCLPTVPPSQAEHVAAGHMKPNWECSEVRTLFRRGSPWSAGAPTRCGWTRTRTGSPAVRVTSTGVRVGPVIP